MLLNWPENLSPTPQILLNPSAISFGKPSVRTAILDHFFPFWTPKFMHSRTLTSTWLQLLLYYSTAKALKVILHLTNLPEHQCFWKTICFVKSAKAYGEYTPLWCAWIPFLTATELNGHQESAEFAARPVYTSCSCYHNYIYYRYEINMIAKREPLFLRTPTNEREKKYQTRQIPVTNVQQVPENIIYKCPGKAPWWLLCSPVNLGYVLSNKSWISA